jgi:hypothetical protein
MTQQTPFLTLNTDCERAIQIVNHRLSKLGYHVVRSFDLQVARASYPGCTCPNHGTDKCDCQMVVLLVYSNESAPISLTAHSHEGKTYFSISESSQPCEAEFENSVLQALTLNHTLLAP